MPIELPNLDDRSFADLVEEGKRLIPGAAPSWTDHNASDPGITFVELFAAIAELLMYRVNRISESNKRAFLRLLAPDRTPTPGWTVDQEISAAIRDQRVEQRAVTASDFERLALEVAGVARAHCLPRRDLDSTAADAADADAPGHVSLLVVATPRRVGRIIMNVSRVVPLVRAHVAERCLLTTRLHVTIPVALGVAVALRLRLQVDQLKAVVEQRALAALQAFFDPISGGADGQGWPFGAPIYRAQIYALMDQVEGVDYVDVSSTANDLFVADAASGHRQIRPDGSWGGETASAYVGLHLKANELVAFSLDKSTIDCDAAPSNIPS